MKVSEILEKKGTRVVTVRPQVTMAEVVATLAGKGIGAAVVSRDGVQVLGLIAERTVIRGLRAHGAALLAMPAAEAMEEHPAVCAPDDTVKQVMRHMTLRRDRHLPVVDRDGRLAGIISIGDVVKSRLDDLELETSVLRDVALAGH